jgi:hypothetical protein
VLVYLVVVYGLGGAWLWWLAYPRGTGQLVAGFVLAAITAALVVVVRRRANRLRSRWERIPSRALTHAGAGPATSFWSREGTDKPDDPFDFEAHVGGGY